MNITITDQEKCRKQRRLEIPSQTVLEETDKVAGELARQVNVPGFRRGHVPKSVVKTRFRKELRDEVLAHILPHSLGDAIRWFEQTALSTVMQVGDSSSQAPWEYTADNGRDDAALDLYRTYAREG